MASVSPEYQNVEGLCLPKCFCPDACRQALKFSFKADDVIVSTYPKCGTTWTQQIIGVLRAKGIPPNGTQEFMRRCPYLEFVGTQGLDQMPSPRFFKCHFPYPLIPKSSEAKYIWVVRNPKDCLVAYYYHTCTSIYNFQGDFDLYFEIYLNGKNDYGDYFDHVMSWYDRRNDPNVLLVYYEELIRDIRGSIARIAKFMGPEYVKDIKDPKLLEDVVKYSSFDYLKKTFSDELSENIGKLTAPEVDIDSLPMGDCLKYVYKHIQAMNYAPGTFAFHILRKGIIGDWRNHFSSDQNKRINEKIEQRLGGTELLEYWKSIGCI